MKSIRFRLLVAALAVLLGGAIANSQTADTRSASAHAWPWIRHGGHMMGFFAKYLDLTDAQQTQMKAVMQKEQATMKPLMQQLHQMDAQLKQYEEGTYDEAKVQALVAQQAQTLVQLKVQETRIHNELFQLLTPDQQAKMKDSRPIGKRACSNTCRTRALPRLSSNPAQLCDFRAWWYDCRAWLGSTPLIPARSWSDLYWSERSSAPPGECHGYGSGFIFDVDGYSSPPGEWFCRSQRNRLRAGHLPVAQRIGRSKSPIS